MANFGKGTAVFASLPPAFLVGEDGPVSETVRNTGIGYGFMFYHTHVIGYSGFSPTDMETNRVFSEYIENYMHVLVTPSTIVTSPEGMKTEIFPDTKETRKLSERLAIMFMGALKEIMNRSDLWKKEDLQVASKAAIDETGNLLGLLRRQTDAAAQPLKAEPRPHPTTRVPPAESVVSGAREEEAKKKPPNPAGLIL